MEKDILDEMHLPLANTNEELEDVSNNHFIPLFDVSKVEVRKESGRDKGIDFRMDVKAKGKITGFRFLVQLKATEKMEPNKDGSVSLTVYTYNINYLLNAGIPAYYVLYFQKENIFLYRDLHEFVKELAQEDSDWAKQASHAMRLTRKLDTAGVNKMYDRAIDHGKFSRKLTERLALSSSMLPERVVIDPNLNVKSDSEIRKLVEDFGFYLINESRWTEILNAHQLGSQHIASTAKYSLIVGIAWYYSGELIKAVNYFKTALKLKHELSLDLLEHLLLFDCTVRFALGLIEKDEYKDKLKSLGSASHIRYFLKIDAIKEEYLKGGERDIEKQYEKFVKEMNAVLEAEDANENIKLLVRCEMVLYEGSKINLDLVRDLSKINTFEFLIGANRKLRQDIAHNLIQRKMAWAEKARGIRDEVIKAKNYFVFYHVLLNETKVDYEFEAYTDLINNGSNPVNIRADERKENLNSLLKNLNQTIQYFQHITYVENVCVALSIKYEILHYMNDMEAANNVLTELSGVIETYDLRELHRKFEALKSHGTTHEKIAQFKKEQAAESLEKQREHQNMVKEMEKMDSLDIQRKIEIESPDTIELYPIHHFQFSKKARKQVYEILNISEQAQVVFDRMLDVDRVIPIANIYHNPILEEGNADGMIFNNSIEAWRNIFRVRKAFFDNGFPRVVLKFTDI